MGARLGVAWREAIQDVGMPRWELWGGEAAGVAGYRLDRWARGLTLPMLGSVCG